jgi:hypothetical protein
MIIKKKVFIMKWIIVVAVILLMGFGSVVSAGETSLAGYATYWNGTSDSGDNVDGFGGGIKLRKKLLSFFAADIRGGYVNFSDLDTAVVPVEATIMVGIPFLLEPYAGIGAGYYIVDSDSDYENGIGTFGVVGVQFNLFVVGAMAELRYNKVDVSLNDENLMDGLSANVGLMIKW